MVGDTISKQHNCNDVQHKHRTELGRTLTHSLDLGRIPLFA